MSRFVPIVRTFTPVMAGVASMKRRTYTTYNMIGALIWAVGLVLIGYVVGDSLGDVDDVTLLPIVGGIVVISFIPVIIEWRRSRREPADPKGDADAQAEKEALEQLANRDD
jgi:membrane-associated protein